MAPAVATNMATRANTEPPSDPGHVPRVQTPAAPAYACRLNEAEQVIDHLRDKGLGVDPVCRVLEPSPSTYFARKKQPKSTRRLRDEQLMPVIKSAHAESGGSYGDRTHFTETCDEERPELVGSVHF
jgi:hypothetical protein